MGKFLDIIGVNKSKTPLNSFPYEKKDEKFKIIEISKERIVPEIDTYVSALEAASSKMIQSRTRLYDFYLTTLMVDDVVQSFVDKRLENINNKELQIFRNGEPIEDYNYFLESPQFADFLKDIIMTKFWGFNVFEFDNFEYENKLWFKYKVIPHKHINPYTKEVLLRQWDKNGVSFENRNDVLFVGNADDLGLLSKVTLLSLYNRLGMFGYSKYLDLASENFQTLKTRGYVDDEEINSISTQLAERGSGGLLTIPDGTDLDVINQSSTQQNQLFEGYIERIKDRLATLILGQTMTTSDGSSYSQAEVHQSEQTKKYSSDEMYVLNILNFEFKDYLPLWFKNVKKEDLEFKFIPRSEDEVRKKLETYKQLKELGVVFEADELRKVFESLL